MEENKELESVEAEVVNEGAKAFTMEDVAKEMGSEGSADGNTGNAFGNAGTAYEEQKVYVEKQSKTFAIVSLILGIFSVICCCTCWGGIVAGVAAIVFGIISIKNEPDGKTMAIIGIVCGGVGLLVGIAGLIFGGFAAVIDGAFDGTDIDAGDIEKYFDFGNM